MIYATLSLNQNLNFFKMHDSLFSVRQIREAGVLATYQLMSNDTFISALDQSLHYKSPTVFLPPSSVRFWTAQSVNK